jgi:sodium--glutamate symport carrier gltS
MEIGIACATFGLILASTMGGPIAKFLITRYDLKPPKNEAVDVGVSQEQKEVGIGYLGFLDAVLAIHVCIIAGYFLNGALQLAGVQLPLFVTCLFSGDSRSFSWYFPGHVPDEYATMDAHRSCRTYPGYSHCAGYRCYRC